MRSLFAFKPTKLSTFISALIKQQQYLLLSNTMNDAASDRLCIDTSIISTGQNSDDLDMYAEISEMKLLKLPGIDNLVHVAPSLHSRALHKNIDLLKKSMRKLKQRDSHAQLHGATGSSDFSNPLLLNEQVNQQEFNNLASPAQQQMQHLNSKPSLKHDTSPCLSNFESVQTGYHNKAYADTHHHQHQPQSQQFFPSNSYPASHLSQQQHHQKTLKPPVPGYPPMNQLYNTNANHQQLYRQAASTGDLTYQHYNSQHNHYQHQQHSFNNHANDKLQDYPKNANNYQPGSFQAPQENLMRLQNNNMYPPPLQPQPQAHQHSQMNHHNQQQQPQHTLLADLGANENTNLVNNSNEAQFSGNVKPCLESNNKSSYEASVSSNEKSNCVTSSNSQTFPSTLTG